MVYGAHRNPAIARGQTTAEEQKHRERVAANAAHEQSTRVRQARPIQQRRKDEKTVMQRPGIVKDVDRWQEKVATSDHWRVLRRVIPSALTFEP